MIKNIIYLDESKMYSLSSQIFEGITEYMLKETNSINESAEEQRGPLGSGKLLADAMKHGERFVEKRFLHDYAFSVFENKLIETNLVVDVHAGSSTDILDQLGRKSFVRVSAQAKFIDVAKITALLSSFNKIGEAIYYVSNHATTTVQLQALQARKQNEKDKTKLVEIRKEEIRLKATSELVKETALYQDPKFLEHLSMVTQFGFSDQLEVQQSVAGHLYSSCLKRQCLRESDDLTIRKYSRMTEKNLVVFGIATQTPTKLAPTSSAAEPEYKNMKEAVTNLIDHITNIEASMSGKADNEVVIDPIAVYVTL